MDRTQILLFSPTLDSMIGEDHPVRLFDELLQLCDWSTWEQHYCLNRGQPPIPPRVVAGVLLYGLSRGHRSSRALEYMLATNIDFLWLASGRQIDHSTLCEFRTKHEQALKDLFRQVFRIALRAGLAELECVALDATRVQANSSRHRTATAATLSERLGALDDQVDRMLAEAREADAKAPSLFGADAPTRLPKGLADLQRRQERLRKAVAAAQAKDAARKAAAEKKSKQGPGPADKESEPKEPTPCSVPVADPDSTIQPNKDGGYAANYTPLATTERTGGFIADTEVLAGGEEPQEAVATVDRLDEQFGRRPRRLLADSAYDEGQGLGDLAAREVEAYIPLHQRPNPATNPVRRDDPTQPVAEEQWSALPKNVKTKKLDRSAFVYDAASDGYYCPMGRRMPYWHAAKKQRRTGTAHCRVYRCEGCDDCPLHARCVASKTGRRTVTRDQHEPYREAMDARLATPAGQAVYRDRKWIAETPFAVLKARMGLRQFLLRGLAKVRTEWRWACTALNVAKLVRAAQRMRIRPAALLT
jgi:transposase